MQRSVGRTLHASADRRLVAAAGVYGLALGTHSLVLLLAPGIALFVLAVEPRIVLRPRFLLACLGTLLVAAVLVFLELPLRAGIFRAPLVYGHPDTWNGFWYVVLAAQFTGSLVAPFADLGGKLGEVARIAATQLGPLAGLIPFALLATAVRRPRYALLTAPAVVITCWFSVSYVNADIGRYYLGPELIVLTWIGDPGRHGPARPRMARSRRRGARLADQAPAAPPAGPSRRSGSRREHAASRGVAARAELPAGRRPAPADASDAARHLCPGEPEPRPRRRGLARRRA